jgi:hypothetical protein
MNCACVFENREQPDFTGRPPRLIEPCGFHAALARDGARVGYPMSHEWHVAINKHSDGKIGAPDFPHFMYDAKALADEVPRMVLVLRLEREGKLGKVHRQCSLSEPETIADNHLTCCLGVECRKCPYLMALEKAAMKPEEIDVAKAWTCASHIMGERKNVDTSEGYLLTTSDRMYWDNVYRSLSQSEDGTHDIPLHEGKG